MGQKHELSETFHFIYMDIVGFSEPRIHATEQVEKINQLNSIVKNSKTFSERDVDRTIVLPTGDGMVIGFVKSCQQPCYLAFEISKALKEYNKKKDDKHQIKLRIGLHSGAVFKVTDINGKENICGNGVIVARRVMDLGKTNHILASDVIAKELKKLSPELDRMIFKVGNCEIKHGEVINIYNIYDKLGAVGNPHSPSPRKFNLIVQATNHRGKPLRVPFTIEKINSRHG